MENKLNTKEAEEILERVKRNMEEDSVKKDTVSSERLTDEDFERLSEEFKDEEAEEDIEEATFKEFSEKYDDNSADKETLSILDKKKKYKLHKNGIIAVATAGIITITSLGFGIYSNIKGQKENSTSNDKVSETITTELVKETTAVTEKDDLDIEVVVDTECEKTYIDNQLEGDFDREQVVTDSNNEAWINEQEKQNSDNVGKVTVDNGYVAPNGDVYESVDEYDKEEDVGTVITEKVLYYATDGTAFETEKDRDAWNAQLEKNNSTEPTLYYATDGTAFGTASERDKYNELLQQGYFTNSEESVAVETTSSQLSNLKNLRNNLLLYNAMVNESNIGSKTL